MWNEYTVSAASFGILMGGVLGVAGGFVAGMTLRFMRGARSFWSRLRRGWL